VVENKKEDIDVSVFGNGPFINNNTINTTTNAIKVSSLRSTINMNESNIYLNFNTNSSVINNKLFSSSAWNAFYVIFFAFCTVVFFNALCYCLTICELNSIERARRVPLNVYRGRSRTLDTVDSK
jgi:hypothetical protein